MFMRLDIAPSGEFYSVPTLVGSSEDERLACHCNTITDGRREEIIWALRIAATTLRQMEARGRC